MLPAAGPKHTHVLWGLPVSKLLMDEEFGALCSRGAQVDAACFWHGDAALLLLVQV